VVTCGNPDAGDDQFGHLVAERLKARALPATEVVDAGMNPCSLTDYLEGRKVLIIVDALWCSYCGVGKVIDVDLLDDDRPKPTSDWKRSTHALSIMDQVDLASKLAMLPKTARLIGVTIEKAKIGGKISESLRKKIDDVVRIIELYGQAMREMKESSAEKEA
jgi:hydrogenase maturation protease